MQTPTRRFRLALLLVLLILSGFTIYAHKALEATFSAKTGNSKTGLFGRTAKQPATSAVPKAAARKQAEPPTQAEAAESEAAPALEPAQSGGSFALTRTVVATSGGLSTGGSFGLNLSVGQTAAGTMSGGAFASNNGFQTGSGCTAPTIASQPNGQTVCAGAGVSFSVTANGSGLSYQWRKNGNPISGATASSLTLAATTVADAATHDVSVSNACGNITSNAATLIVNPVTAITTQPVSQTVMIGQAAAFSVTAAGANLSYQWRKNGVAISGATASSLTIAAATPGDAAPYDVLVTGACGAATSTAAALAVTCPVITLTPATLPAGTEGAPYQQTLTASPAGGNYTFALTSGALPQGITLTSAGVLAGTTNRSGSFSFRITATGFGTCSGFLDYTLVFNKCANVSLDPNKLPKATVGLAYNQTFSATPTGTSYTFTISNGALPPGLALNSASGVLSGVPTANDKFSFEVTATSTEGCQGARKYNLTVGASTAALAFQGDYDGDGIADLTLWANTGVWGIVKSANRQSQARSWGTAGDVPVLGDYDGDGLSDLAVFRPDNGMWYVKRSGDDIALVKAWGQKGDVLVPSDYDGDGKTDLAVWRPSNGTWYVLRSSDGSFLVEAWGTAGDTPVVGDYDGDGKADLAVWRGSTGNWYVKLSTGGIQVTAWGAGYAPYFDTPVPADYDGDGKTDLAIWRGQNSLWYIRQSTDGQPLVRDWGANYAPYNDVPVPGDYDGDGKADIAVWRPTTGTWFVLRSDNGSFLVQQHGQPGDVPVPAYGVR